MKKIVIASACRTAIIQSFKECFFICYLSFICAQKYEISSLF